MTEAIKSGRTLPPSKLAHVVLRSPRPKPMVEFYKAFLGAHVVAAIGPMTFITYDDEHHRIAIGAFPGCGDKVRNSAGLEHIAFSFDTLNDLFTAYRQRKAHGILPIWCVNHGPTTSLYANYSAYQDPDGNVLETQVDNFDNVEDANEFMMSPAFVENVYGVDFDPEELIKRLESGEPESEIKKRPEIGPRSIETLPLLNPPPPLVKDSYDIIEA
ncbi:Glyoxalase/Bleomycin resistance protein/Dihydroxybiphenyl dioxygenase [Hypoxylon trugodes]|uniref:Glyoxalase/Bleomycin resistance protein/Dihydroxybiphenyl dioxygenase n=1 Tax=Hypoxylon trugodes TaxID=326681 RepID=UPI00219CE7F7|nr:Glyoxalase/Bleomycin resistance protein/Dihydroxybiphenyl dioxygenase [Hypoxylon trugodes]KAI1392978.1 Glyoxalase/Bleomycin resistance protein/Dihydroxybiphenyl dioxygenase [Hypoxylon trugodes]